MDINAEFFERHKYRIFMAETQNAAKLGKIAIYQRAYTKPIPNYGCIDLPVDFNCFGFLCMQGKVVIGKKDFQIATG